MPENRQNESRQLLRSHKVLQRSEVSSRDELIYFSNQLQSADCSHLCTSNNFKRLMYHWDAGQRFFPKENWQLTISKIVPCFQSSHNMAYFVSSSWKRNFCLTYKQLRNESILLKKTNQSTYARINPQKRPLHHCLFESTTLSLSRHTNTCL
jgi:hypothetical protein